MPSRSGPQLPAAWIAAAAGCVPLLAVHAAWAISLWSDAIAPGWPYLDGSTSISGACRQPPAVHLFRALVLPSATLGALTWWVCAGWLGSAGLAGLRLRRWVLGLGLAAALFLVLYATFLGTQGPVYRLLRRYGVYVYFGGTSIVELIVTIVLARARPRSLEPWVLRALQAICALFLLAGPLNLLADHFVDQDRAANLFEWWFALGMSAYPLLLARVWRRERLRLELTSERD